MTLSELYTQLKTSNIPVAYDHFPEADCPDPPFIVYRVIGTDNFGADDAVYQKVLRVEIELITIGRDAAAEEALEEALAFTFWDMTDTFSDDERVWSTYYTIEI